MLVEEIARLTGTLKFNVDARPLVTFEKRLNSVMQQLEAFSKVANKKFNIKVALDSKTLRAQLDKAAAAKVIIKNFDVDHTGITELSQKITTKLGNAPVRLSNIRIDIGSLIEQKRLVRTLVEQVKVDLPVKLQFTQATKMLREWKKTVEETFKVKLDAFAMQSPKVKLSLDREHLHKEIREALAQIRAETRIKVQLDARGPSGGGGGRGRAPSPTQAGIFGAGAGGALGSAAGGFGRGLIPGLGAAFAVSNLNQISQEITGQELALRAVTGSKEAAEATKARLEEMGDEIGFDTRSVAGSFTKMIASGKGAGFTQEQTEQVFKSMTEYGRVMGLDTEAMKGSLRAVEQMMNKGQIMSEELKGQLGERFPAAVALMAEATGKTTAELLKAMENGEIKSDVLIKFAKLLSIKAREGDALALAMETTAAQQARFNNAFTKAVEMASEAGFDKGIASFFKSATDALQDAEPLVKALGSAFNILIRPVNALMLIMGEIGKQWPKIAEAFGLTSTQLSVLAVAAGALLLPFGGILLAISGLALVVEDLIAHSKGMDSVFGDWLKSLSPELRSNIEITGQMFKTLGEEVSKAIKDIGAAFGEMESFDGGTFLNFAIDRIQTMIALLTTLAKTMGAVARGDWAAVGGNLQDIGVLSTGILPPAALGEQLLNKDLRDRIDFRYDQLTQATYMQDAVKQANKGTVGVFPMNQPPPAPMSTMPEKDSVQQFGPVQIEIKVMPGMDKPREIATEVNRHLQDAFKAMQLKEVK